MKKEKVIVSIKNGIIIDVKAPAGTDVMVRDYDVPYVENNPEKTKTDGYGKYIEQIW